MSKHALSVKTDFKENEKSVLPDKLHPFQLPYFPLGILLWCDHSEPDILECKVKWALGSITMNKASGGDGILVELFQILKDDAVKVLYSICPQIWKPQQWPRDWKRSVFFPIPKKGNAKECSLHVLARLCSKSFKLDVSTTWKENFQLYRLGLEKI